MHRGIGFHVNLILFIILAGSTLRAGEPPSDVTCPMWNRASAGEKLMYAVGYSVGATHAAATAGLRSEKDRLAREILMQLLPETYRFGSIVLDVDASRGLAAASDKSIMTVLDDIAREKNALLIYQYENQAYEQFFEKLKR